MSAHIGIGEGATQLNASLLTISVIAVLLPAAFHVTFTSSPQDERADILAISHGVRQDTFTVSAQLIVSFHLRSLSSFYSASIFFRIHIYSKLTTSPTLNSLWRLSGLSTLVSHVLIRR